MLVNIIEMIEKNAETMAGELKNKLLSDPATLSYQTLDARNLYANIFEVYSQLGYWLLRDTMKGEGPTHYSALGKHPPPPPSPSLLVVVAWLSQLMHTSLEYPLSLSSRS